MTNKIQENTGEERIKRISELTLKLAGRKGNRSDKHTLKELFELTGDKNFILRAIELVNPSDRDYPQNGAMGGCDFGDLRSAKAALYAEKAGERELAVNYWKEAISRLERYQDEARREQGLWKRTLKPWDSQDDATLKNYWKNVIRLEDGDKK